MDEVAVIVAVSNVEKRGPPPPWLLQTAPSIEGVNFAVRDVPPNSAAAFSSRRQIHFLLDQGTGDDDSFGIEERRQLMDDPGVNTSGPLDHRYDRPLTPLERDQQIGRRGQFQRLEQGAQRRDIFDSLPCPGQFRVAECVGTDPTTDFASLIVCPAEQLSVDDDSRPDAAAHAQADKVPQTAALAAPKFRQGDRAEIVLDRDRNKELPGQSRTDRHLLPVAQKGIPQRDTPRGIDRAGHAESDSKQIVVLCSGDFRDRIGDDLQHALDRRPSGNSAADFFEWLLGEIDRRGENLPGVEIDADEPAGARVEFDDDRWAPQPRTETAVSSRYPSASNRST